MTYFYFIFPLFIFILFLFRKNQSFYPYKTSLDYKFDFEENTTLKYIKNQPINLPHETNENNTLFIKIKLESSLLGYFIQPYIKIKTSEGIIYKQYFEHGAKGYRYLNVSNITSPFYILGNRINIKNQELKVIRFNKEKINNKNILIISPHADDAEIAAYGLYEKYAKNVFILTISAGEKGKFKYRELYSNKEIQHRKKGEIRIWNGLTVPLLAGVSIKNVLTFGLFNETLEDMYLDREKIISSKILDTDDITIFTKQNFSPLAKGLTNISNWKSFVKNLEYVINDFQPDIIVTPHPYIDSHEDHQYSTIGCIEAIKNLNLSKGELFLYTNHYTDAEYYPYGKLGSIMSLPPKFDNSIYFESIYSHPLNELEQTNKILAFDAMNDLRPNTEYRFWYRLFSDGFTRGREKLFSIEKDYFNRYVRSNELFYVVNFKSLSNPKILNKLMPKNFKDN